LSRYILRRLWQSALVLLGVSMVVFAIVRIGGNPAILMLPPQATDAQIRAFAHEMGFDRPITVQYAQFLVRALRGDLGQSLQYHQSALGLVLGRFPYTLELACAAMVVALVVGIPTGVVAAVRRSTVWDDLAVIGALFGQSLPIFWTGIVLILFLSVDVHWFPSFGIGGLSHLVLPALALGLYSAGRIMRLVRSGTLDVLGQDYIRTARAKGLRESRVIYRHALRNALLPVITLVGLELGTNLSGAVVTETVFGWPGIGSQVVQAIFQRDYPIVQAVQLLVAVVFVTLNFLIDLVYGLADPRVRYA
jgi:ABC-type dipeptide/oligopeptide/nickel transport system permease component